jgi:tRNA (guanine37-N1)-methyltransferase
MVKDLKHNLKVMLRGKLSDRELASVYKSYDIIGDIAVIRIHDRLLHCKETIAEALMKQHKQIKAVWRQSSPVSGDFRLRELEWIKGGRRTETTYKEHGCQFRVDLRTCYFSPRLGFERMRIANLVGDKNEVLVNMFSGVGTYSIIIAKHSMVAKIYSIDINPTAMRYQQENILINKMVNRVFPIMGDAEIIIKHQLENVADRVLMPLPEKAHEYLSSALSTIKPQGGWIHYYGFEYAKKGEDPIEKASMKVAERLERQNANFELLSNRIVRQTGPNWYQIAVDIKM